MERAKSPAINTENVNAKKRKVFRDSKGRTYVKQDDKKVYVKKLFTPSKNSTHVKSTVVRSPADVKSPMINTGKVNAKKRRVFRDSKDRTYVKQDGKKVYVKKLFTPRTIAMTNTEIKGREKQLAILRESPIKTKQILDVPKNYYGVKLDCSTPAGLFQESGTCWFNSTLNGFILAEATAKMIFDKINLMNSSEITALAKDFPTDSCPIILSRKYVFHYFLKIHSGRNYSVIGKKGKKSNIPVYLMSKMFTPKALKPSVARGNQGGHPREAAKRILSKVFTPDETGTLRDWETAFPNDFNKYTMVFREGVYVYSKTKWLYPDTHPQVINTEDGKTKFNLSHIVYVVSWTEKKRVEYHAVVGYVCGGQKYVYDSNNSMNLKVDWSNPANRKKILAYSGAKKFEPVAYTLYIKEI